MIAMDNDKKATIATSDIPASGAIAASSDFEVDSDPSDPKRIF
jgi:hypothetical protein